MFPTPFYTVITLSDHGDVVVPDLIVYRCGLDAVFQHHASIFRQTIRTQALRQVLHGLQYYISLPYHYLRDHTISLGTGNVD